MSGPWRVLEWTDKHALEFGVLIREYRITRDDTGEFLRCHDGIEWFTDDVTTANRVCQEANEAIRKAEEEIDYEESLDQQETQSEVWNSRMRRSR